MMLITIAPGMSPAYIVSRGIPAAQATGSFCAFTVGDI